MHFSMSRWSLYVITDMTEIYKYIREDWNIVYCDVKQPLSKPKTTKVDLLKTSYRKTLSFCGFISTPSLLALPCFGTFLAFIFNFLNYFLWLRISDEGPVPKMRIWSTSLGTVHLIFRGGGAWVFGPGQNIFFWQKRSKIIFFAGPSGRIIFFITESYIYNI